MKIIMANLIRYLFMVSMFGGILTSIVSAQNNVGASISSQLNAVCGDIKTFVGILVVVLLALGAVLYAISHVLPAAGNIKGNLQGWSLNMVVGAIVALIIYFLAPWIAQQIVNFGNPNNGTAVGSLIC